MRRHAPAKWVTRSRSNTIPYRVSSRRNRFASTSSNVVVGSSGRSRCSVNGMNIDGSQYLAGCSLNQPWNCPMRSTTDLAFQSTPDAHWPSRYSFPGMRSGWSRHAMTSIPSSFVEAGNPGGTLFRTVPVPNLSYVARSAGRKAVPVGRGNPNDTTSPAV